MYDFVQLPSQAATWALNLDDPFFETPCMYLLSIISDQRTSLIFLRLCRPAIEYPRQRQLANFNESLQKGKSDRRQASTLLFSNDCCQSLDDSTDLLILILIDKDNFIFYLDGFDCRTRTLNIYIFSVMV